MKVIVTGRTSSGKSTFKEIVESLTNKDIIESDARSIFLPYHEGDKIVIIDTPAILCHNRTVRSFSMSDQKKEDDMLSYVTELPNCTIIKNAGSLDDFRVKIKKFIKTL